MNPSMPSTFPGIGGKIGPIWHPPIESRWILTGLIVFAGAVAKKLNPSILKAVASPIGFFLTVLIALAIFKEGFPPGAFAVLFFLLMVWLNQTVREEEGFLNAHNTVDWVTNSKRWFVESVLKERPVGIQDKDVRTFPVQGASAQGSTQNGTS